MTKIKQAAETVGGVLVAILTIDAFGFVAWIASGQTPADNFYIGSITAHILRALL